MTNSFVYSLKAASTQRTNFRKYLSINNCTWTHLVFAFLSEAFKTNIRIRNFHFHQLIVSISKLLKWHQHEKLFSSGVISLANDRNHYLASYKMECCKPKLKGHYYRVFVNSINPTPEPLVPVLGLPSLGLLSLVAARMLTFSSFSHAQPLTLLILHQPMLSH